VTSVAGFADKAVLAVLRPDTLENYTALSYKVGVGCCQGAAHAAEGLWLGREGSVCICTADSAITHKSCLHRAHCASRACVILSNDFVFLCRLSCMTRLVMPLRVLQLWCPLR